MCGGITTRLGLDQGHVRRQKIQGFAIETSENAEHLELGGMVSRSAGGRTHCGRSMACHAGQNLAGAGRESPCGQRPNSARAWTFGPQLHPAVYKSRHDHAAGCVDLGCPSRGVQILDAAGKAGLGNASVADQQCPIRNNTEITQFRTAPRSGRAAQSDQLARPADQHRFGFCDTLEWACQILVNLRHADTSGLA